jgi:hypothetical protein
MAPQEGTRSWRVVLVELERLVSSREVVAQLVIARVEATPNDLDGRSLRTHRRDDTAPFATTARQRHLGQRSGMSPDSASAAK